MKNQTFLPADILLPKTAALEDWSVIACDQFSSDHTYWDRVTGRTQNKPSTMHMVVPEAYLEGMEMASAARSRNAVMEEYLRSGVFTVLQRSYVYIEREITGGVLRRGLVGMLDLDTYEFTKGTSAPVRASENTVVSRLPPRITVRENAALELPHVMVLIDDPQRTVVEPLTEKKESLPLIYDFDLMEGGGHIRGWQVAGEAADSLSKAFESYAERPVEIVIGDGNHSLAAAKACWDRLKPQLSEKQRKSHPAKYALVELNNVYDDGICFEPIHRVVFGVEPQKLLHAMEEHFGIDGSWDISWHTGEADGIITVPAASLGGMIGALQNFLEEYTAAFGGTIDYIHDDEAALGFARAGGNMAFLLPPMDKSDLFKTVLAEGVFPKKSFSIGHARDKRYYLECREIK